MSSTDAQRLSAIAIEKIAKDFGLSPLGAARIRGTNYVFDDILQNGQDLYGVEVKCGYNRAMIEKTLHEFEMFRFSLPTGVRKRFTIILCVISKQTDFGWRDELMDRMKDADITVRMYTTEELERA